MTASRVVESATVLSPIAAGVARWNFGTGRLAAIRFLFSIIPKRAEWPPPAVGSKRRGQRGSASWKGGELSGCAECPESQAERGGHRLVRQLAGINIETAGQPRVVRE